MSDIWSNTLLKALEERKHVYKHYNSKCLSCSVVHEEMIRIGAMIFCEYCASSIFKTDDPVRKEREAYLEWLNKYKEEYDL